MSLIRQIWLLLLGTVLLAAGIHRGPLRLQRTVVLRGEPGAIVDSSTSNRATAKRTGANGSTAGGADADAEAPAEAIGDGAATDGAGDASGPRRGVTV